MFKWIGLDYGNTTNRPHVGFGTTGGVPCSEVFLRDPSPYLNEFQRKSQETLKG